MAKPAPTPAPAEGEAPKKKSKLLLIIIIAVVFLAAAGAGAFFFLKKNHAEAEGDADGGHKEPAKTAKKHKAEPNKPPTFITLETFTVNLKPETGEQYLALTVALKMEDDKSGDSIKAYMPKIRSDINKLLMQTKPASLNTPEGLETLASDIQDKVNAVVGTPGGTDKKGKKLPPQGPVEEVHFPNIIVQ